MAVDWTVLPEAPSTDTLLYHCPRSHVSTVLCLQFQPVEFRKIIDGQSGKVLKER